AADLVRVAEGARAKIQVDAVPGLALTGRVVMSSPSIDPATSLGPVRIAIDAPPPGLMLRLGMAGIGVVEVTGRSDAVWVPAIAIRRSTAGAEEVVVCIFGGEHPPRAKVQPIEVRVREKDRVEVTSGVEVGEQVVVTHVLGLEDGAELAPTES